MENTTQIWKKPFDSHSGKGEKKACLTIMRGSSIGAVYKLNNENVLGCSKGADIILTDVGISRRHFLIKKTDKQFIIRDLKSTNGTGINDKKIMADISLVDGDKISIADTVLKFSYYDAQEASYQKQVRSLIVTDDLTKIYNKRYFTETIEKEFNFAQRNQSSLSLIMLDIDHFKLFNDQYGHQTGDFILTKIAELIIPLARNYDTFARFGGEEFVLLLRETTLSDAIILAERMNQIIANHKFNYQGQCLQATISLGVATYHAKSNINDHHQLIGIADHYLYKAKHAGRNRVCFDNN